MTDVLGYLQSKGLELKQGRGDEVYTWCFFHNEEEYKRGRLYINTNPSPSDGKPPGVFKCFVCGVSGALNKIKKHFGDPIDQKDIASIKIQELYNIAAEYYHINLVENPDAFEYLRYSRGLSMDIIENHKLGWADGTLRQYLEDEGYNFTEEELLKSGLVFELRQSGQKKEFLYKHVTIPYIVTGNVCTIRGHEIGGKYFSLPDADNYLFNIDVLQEANEVILTEGEFDAMVLEDLGYDTISVPGANTGLEDYLHYFSEIKKVYLCYDNDTAGQTGSEKASRALGAKSRAIEMPAHTLGEKKNDPSEWIINKGHSKEDFDVLVRRAKGGYLISIQDAYDEWLDVEGNPNHKGLKLGWEKLDSIIYPGALPGQVMVLLSKTGAGKTLFICNTMENMITADPDIDILFLTLEMTRNEVWERMRRLKRFQSPNLTDKELISRYINNIHMVDKNRIKRDEVDIILDQFNEEKGKLPDAIFLDYIGYYARSYKGESYERTGAAIHDIKSIAKDNKLFVFAPHQVNRQSNAGEEMDLSAARDSGVIEETADYLLGLVAKDQRKGREASEHTGEIDLRIFKSRHGGAGQKVSMQFAPLSLAMLPHGHRLQERAKEEIKKNLAGYTYEKILEEYQS